MDSKDLEGGLVLEAAKDKPGKGPPGGGEGEVEDVKEKPRMTPEEIKK